MTKIGFPEIPAHYVQAATEILKEKIKIKSSLILSRDDLSQEEKNNNIDKMFIWDNIGEELSYFLHAVEYGTVKFDDDRTNEPDFQE